MKYTFSHRLPSKEYAVVLLTESREAVLVDGKQFLLEVSIGKREEMNRRKLITAIRKAVVLAKKIKTKSLALVFQDFEFPQLQIPPEELAELIAVNLELANFEFNKYRTKPKDGWNSIANIAIVGKISKEAEQRFKRGKIIGEGINRARILANTPGGAMTPLLLAEEAYRLSEGLPISITILDEIKMKELGMGAVLGVGMGSKTPPRFIVMEYMAGNEKEKPIVLVGKGITFDSGGLNLKPSNAIYEMHLDMSGGAAVMEALILAAKLKLKKNIIALIPAAENMPSGESYRPGDQLKTMSGTTIEIMNTDAEGRVVLADALIYAKKYHPRLVVDVATLTGASMVALGTRASAVFSKDEKLTRTLTELGEQTGDYLWPLPLWDEYETEIKGTFGDWANEGKTRYGGAIHGAIFLYQFAKDYPWAHIDMAPRMSAVEGDYLSKGATGEPIRLLLRLLEIF